jgi:WD40 repeat protein
MSAKSARAAAEIARNEAEEQRTLTQDALSAAESNLYFKNVDLAERELRAGNIEFTDRLLKEVPASLRQWEWHYLSRLNHMEEAVLAGHRDAVRALVFDADGRLRTAGADGVVKIWDLSKYREVASITLPGVRDGSSGGIQFAPDGRILYRHREFWDLSTSQEAFTIPEFYRIVTFSPDNRIVTAAIPGAARSRLLPGMDDTVTTADPATPILRTFAPETGRELATLFRLSPVRAATTAVTAPWNPAALAVTPEEARFSADGSRFGLLLGNGVIKVLNARTGEELLELAPNQDVSTPAFSYDGAMLAASTGGVPTLGFPFDTKTIRLWSTSTGNERWSLHLGRQILGIEFNPAGHFLAAALDDNTIRLINNSTGVEVARLVGHTGRIHGLLFTPDGSRLVSYGADKTVRIWRIEPLRAKLVFEGGQDARAPRIAKVSPDARRLLSLAGSTLKLWDLNTQRLLIDRDFNRTLQRRVAGFTPDSGRIYVSEAGGPADIRFLDVRTGRDLSFFQAPSDTPLLPDFKLIPKRERAAVVSFPPARSATELGLELQIWNTAVGRMITRVSLLSGLGSGTMELSPDGMLCAVWLWSSVSRHVTLALHDASTGGLIRRLDVPQPAAGVDHRTSQLVFTSDSKRLAAVTNARAITIWDTATGRTLLTLPEHSSPVLAMAFSPDGARLVSVSAHGEVRLWDSHSGRPLILLGPSSGPYPPREISVNGPPSKEAASFSISYSPDGHQIRLDTVTHGPEGLTVQIATWNGAPLRR